MSSIVAFHHFQDVFRYTWKRNNTVWFKGEVLPTIMVSIVQDESCNISGNVTWGMRKRFADEGAVMPYDALAAD